MPCVKCGYYSNLALQRNCEVDIILHILWVRKLRPKELEYLNQGHTGFEPKHLGSRVHTHNPEAVLLVE